MDDLDRRILDRLQQGVPLVPEPFDVLAADLQIGPDTLMDRARALKTQAIVREIAGVFDTRRLGYDSALVGARIPPQRLDRAVEIINAHPGVTHNYARDHAFNVWFTLAVAPESTLGLDGTIERLDALTGASAMRRMRALKVYKLAVRLPMVDRADACVQPTGRSAQPVAATDTRPTARWPAPIESDRRLVRALRRDLPIERQPFEPAASGAGMDVQQLLQGAERLARAGVLRRFAAVLHHRRAGFETNALAVWRVPAERVDPIGVLVAACPLVSHCYQRETHPDWSYNLLAMVHARGPAECQSVLDELQRQVGLPDHAVLYSVAEYKKARLPYFSPDFAAWEAAHQP